MDQRKPIHIAAAQGDVELLRQELEKGVSPDTPDERHGFTPLHYLCHGGSPYSGDKVDCVNLLIEAGANVDATMDDSGWTPVHSAVAYNAANILAALIDAGADVSPASSNGKTPLHLTILYSSHRCVVPLLRAGAAVNARDRQGLTPLEFGDKQYLRRREFIFANLLRFGAALPAETGDEFVQKVIAAGSFRAYEKNHLNALAGIFAPKFSRLLPPEMVRRVLEFAYPVGDH